MINNCGSLKFSPNFHDIYNTIYHIWYIFRNILNLFNVFIVMRNSLNFVNFFKMTVVKIFLGTQKICETLTHE